MKIRYDGEGDILDILIKEGQIDHAAEHGEVIVNHDANGEVIEIEILNASQFLGDFLTGVIKAKSGSKLVEIG